ncbi:MAG TPA: TIGR04141 family sporadically distributed protein [Pyrinomonadaceae bacterium]|nr:TIGR04141 family sporadically distributed protein [Pyrinomonadaceae bacterium]
MDNELPFRSLTIHLSKENQTPDSLIEQAAGVKTKSVIVGRRRHCPLIIKPSAAKSPSWANFFAPYVKPDEFGFVSSASAVLLVPVNERWAALTFGQGRHLLQMQNFEDRFGLRVVLNCIDKDKIKVIDRQTFDAIASHKLEQASQEANAREFGFDFERDILRAVTGTPLHIEFGKRISGMESLNTLIQTDLKELNTLLEKFHDKFFEDSYRKDFEWVDQIGAVTDSALESELNEALLDLIWHRKLNDRCWLAVPDIIDWLQVDGFRYSTSNRQPKHHDLDLSKFLETFDDFQDLSEDRLKNRYIYCMDADDQIVKRWSAFNCLYCEIDYDRLAYVLNAGKWYVLDNDFVKKVNCSFDTIRRYPGSFADYDDDTEGKYNERLVAESNGDYHLMDRNLTYRGGPIEFCDVFSKSKELIHIKRDGGSATLSHLFYQGTTSAEFFQIDPEYRKLIWDKLPKAFQTFKPDDRPKSQDFHVVFGIVTNKKALRLPFFSRVGVRHAVSRLQAFGYRVSLARIGITDARSKLQRYRSAEKRQRRSK